MPKYVWVQINNPKNRYYTGIADDPNVPAGYALTNTSDGSWQGVDGVHDQDVQVYRGGLMSGGFPAYNGYTDGSTSNGILGGGNV